MVFQPRLIRGELAPPFPQHDVVMEKVFHISEIRESRTFSEAEILGLIEQIAFQEGFKLNQLRLKKKGLDENGNLVSLLVIIDKKVVQERGDTEIEYGYILAGKHGGNFSDESIIYRVYNGSDSEYSAGGIVATYKDGSWVITPHALAHKITGPIKEE